MNIGEKIRAARIEKGMTQEELGEILGVKKSAIAKYENGRVVNIKRSTLKKISDVLGIRPSELIFDGDPRKTAEFHADVLLNEDVMEMVKEYMKLDSKKKKIVKDLIYTLAGAEA